MSGCSQNTETVREGYDRKEEDSSGFGVLCVSYNESVCEQDTIS